MKLTPSILAGMYYALRATEPFPSYRLPHPSKIKFRVTRTTMSFGEYEPDPHTIRVSREACNNYNDALQTMAHEMTHMALERKGARDHANHDADFNALAAKVCDAWGWNFKEF